MGTLPFLPHPPKCEQQFSAGQTSSSSLLLNGDTGNGLDEAEQSDDLKDFLDLSGDASDGSFRENNALAFDEQMEFQFLSEQLGIAITDNEKSPHLDDIYGTPPQLSSLPVSSCSTQSIQNLGPPVKVQLSSSQSSSSSATINKSRLRWTLELHEHFLEAVKKLEGPEKATPKGVLKLMKIRKIRVNELIAGVKPSKCQISGDPKNLEANLHDLHPASWYCFAWYPIYRIPDGKFQAAFLTYHSLGHWIHQSSSDGAAVLPVIGLQSYNAKAEWWFETSKSDSEGTDSAELQSSEASQILKERLRTLNESAAVMSRANVLKNGQMSRNRHSDFEFFLSRS